MRTHTYSESLSITSQFFYCGLPLRLDTYSKCLFQCQYCFAHARGGAYDSSTFGVADPNSLGRRLERVNKGLVASAIDEFLALRQPIHWGGMSDPFSPQERSRKTTLAILRVLVDHQYPCVISTKSDLYVEAEYMDLLKHGRFVLQVSLADIDDELLQDIDKGVPSCQRRLYCGAIAADSGIPTAIRIQPLLPTREHVLPTLLSLASAHGFKHAALEHLKLPLEKSYRGTEVMSKALGIDLFEYFKGKGSQRVGREWVLPVSGRLENMLLARSLSREEGMTFGAADNDLLWLSSGGCCCSGVSHFPGFEGYHKLTYSRALKIALEKGIDVSYELIAAEDHPKRTISHHVNSKSRLKAVDSQGLGISSYLQARWNNPSSGPWAGMFYGLEHSGHLDTQGLATFRPNSLMRQLFED